MQNEEKTSISNIAILLFKTQYFVNSSFQVIAAIWFLALVLNIPMAAFYRIYTGEQGARECRDE